MLRIITSVLFTLFLVYGYCQQSVGYFRITGKVQVEQGVVDATSIEVYRNGALQKNIKLNRTGSFVVPVDLNQTFLFKFIKESFYPKTIEVDTHIPPDVCSSNCVFPPYQLSVMLFKKVPGVKGDDDISGRIAYNSTIDNFDVASLQSNTGLKSPIGQVIKELEALSAKYEMQRLDTKNSKYNKAIEEADALYRKKVYDAAMNRYRDAAMVKPSQLYPRQRVDQIYRILVTVQITDILGAPSADSFLKYLNYGDVKFKEREYVFAVIAYQRALALRPDDSDVAMKLRNAKTEEVKLKNLAIEELAHKDEVYLKRVENYKQRINEGNKKFLDEKFAEAKDFFGQAATQIDENSYALLAIKKIDELLNNDEEALRLALEKREAEQQRLRKAREQAYNDAIKEADRLFDERIYRDALETYGLALTIKSFEVYPKQQISRIQDILADLQLRGEEYNRLLREGDQQFYAKEYANARETFVDAHHLIPEEDYAQKKIEAIDQILSNLSNVNVLDEQYDRLIVEADKFLTDNKYKEAIETYQKASDVKPQEVYPKNQITKIRELLARENEAQRQLLQKQKNYDQALANADKAFDQKAYENSRSFYQQALTFLPGQEYPQKQIRTINAILEKQKSEAEKSILELIDFSDLKNISENDRAAAYKEAMELGNKFLASKEYGVSRFYFRRALALIINDPSAKAKLDEVDRLIHGNNADEIKYNEMVKKADEAFGTGDFSVARFYYIKAQEYKPNDAYTKERLQVVTELTQNSVERENNREFADAIKRGNDAFAQKNYSAARFYYRKATSIKPNDATATTKLKQAEQAMSNVESQNSNNQYQQSITLGDQAMRQNRYAIARNYYRQALVAKPGDEYATQKLSEIQSKIGN